MYGLVNKAIHDLVMQEHGEDAWEEIAERADVDSVGFVSMDAYDDDVTYRLVGAASEILEVQASALLEAFGEFWVRYTAREGYGEMLDAAGTDFGAFLANLDGLHVRVGRVMPGLRPPSFAVQELGDDRFRVLYRSDRAGLEPMVVGLLRGLAAKFELDAEVEWDPQQEDAGASVFLVRARARCAP